jgi:hypothetical protein
LETTEKIMSDVSVEDQAALAIVFEENIRDLVRKHLKAALEDMNFMATVNTYPMAEGVLRHLNPTNLNFQQAVKTAIVNQMNKY